MTPTKDYNPAFDVLMDALSSGNIKTKDRLEKYVAHRAQFGRQASQRIYPDCYNIQISDPQLKNIWNNVLLTVDKMGKSK
jgi:hypothetical protein